MGLGGLTMFDDLHDPDPPTPGMDTLASVTARARQIRQRRVQAMCWTGVVGMISIAAMVTIPRLGTGDDDTDLLLDSPTVTDTAAPFTAPPTSNPGDPANTSNIVPIPSPVPVPESTDASTTTPPTVTAPTTPPPATTAPAAPSRSSIVAIDGNGDAVLVEPDGTTTLIYDGVDPDDPLPSEGDVVTVNGVTALPDRSQAFVSVCCEPIPGSIVRWPSASDNPNEFFAYGNAAVLSPDGESLAAVVVESISLVGLADDDYATLAIDATEASPIELAFTNNGSLAVLVSGPDRASIVFLDRSGDTFAVRATVELDSASSPTTTRYSLAGLSEDTLFVLDAEAGVLQTYDWFAGERVGEWDGAEFGGFAEPVRVAFDGATLRYVDTSRRLFVDGDQVPGEYIWVG
jgi:hypothetical protein